MLTFIMLTRISPGAVHAPQTLEDLEKRVMEQIRQECEGVDWVHSYTLLGPYNYLDIFHAPDIDTALKVSTIFRSYGHAHAEIWPATDWGRFKELIHELESDTTGQPGPPGQASTAGQP